MTDVQFEEENMGTKSFTSRKLIGDPVTPKMARNLVRFKIVSTPKQAEYLMITICIFSILAAIVIYMYYVLGYNPFASKKQINYSNLAPEIRAQLPIRSSNTFEK